MPTTTIYPSLSNIIKLQDLPEQFSFLQDGLNSFFEEIYYSDYVIIKNYDEGQVFIDIEIVAVKPIGFNLPGTDFRFVLNPDQTSGIDSTFPIKIVIDWPILKYYKDFSINNFSFSADAIFNLIIDIFKISEKEVIKQAVSIFVTTNQPYNTFVDSINSNYSLSGTDAIHYSPATDEDIIAEDILNSVNNNTTLQALHKDIYASIFETYINSDAAFDKIDNLLFAVLGDSVVEFVKQTLRPKITATLILSAGLEFPRTVLIPLNADGTPTTGVYDKTMLIFASSEFTFSTESGFGYAANLEVSLNPVKSQIGDTGITISIEHAKLDLSRTTNIPEATADGRPDDFIGVFIESAAIGLPSKWFSDSGTTSTAQIVGKNLIIGTGGISGTLGFDTENGILHKKIGNFDIELDAFSITFQQNSITGCEIEGKITLPSPFLNSLNQPAVIDIDLGIDHDGNFKVTAKPISGLVLKLKDFVAITINELSVGKKDNKFFIITSCKLDIIGNLGSAASMMPAGIELKKLTIWDDGKFEIEGGSLVLPKALSCKIGPVELSITAIGVGTHEQNDRKYMYLEFSGGININPGGIDARGDGIKLYFTIDNGNFDWFIRIQSIKISLTIPGNASPSAATLIMSGYLSMKNADSSVPNSPAGTEYMGGIEFSLPKLNIAGSAAMRMNPKTPSFIVDVGVELPTPIPLGATGLGFYGFRGLFGKHYVPSKVGVGLSESASWYEYYKKPDEGINVPKLKDAQGLSIGLGASLATVQDGGKALSSKLFIMLNLPDLVLLEGSVGVMVKQRIGLSPGTDPPFRFCIAITPDSLTAGISVNYKLPTVEDSASNAGKIINISGTMEMGFFFHNSNAWYINIGTDIVPIQARILNLFDVKSYLMLSASGIKTGAEFSKSFSRDFGKLHVELTVCARATAEINFRPKQLSGSIMLGGRLTAKYRRFKLGGISVSVTLSATSPKPFVIKGVLTITISISKWDFSIDFEIAWVFEPSLDYTPITLHNEIGKGAKARNILTDETYELYCDYTGTLSNPDSIPNIDKYIVPLDSYIDIEFTKPIACEASNISGQPLLTNNTENVPLQPNVVGRLLHTFIIKSVNIYSYKGSGWVPYKVYNALESAYSAIPESEGITLNNPHPSDYNKDGFWQTGAGNKITLLSKSTLNWVQQGANQPILDNYNVTLQQLFNCDTQQIITDCLDFNNYSDPTVQSDTLLYRKTWYQIIGDDGTVQQLTNYFGMNKALIVAPGSKLEIYFQDPVPQVRLKISGKSPLIKMSYFRSVEVATDHNLLPVMDYELIQFDQEPCYNLFSAIDYDAAQNGSVPLPSKLVSKIEIEAEPCLPNIGVLTPTAIALEEFLNGMAVHHLLTSPIILNTDITPIFNSLLTPILRIPFNNNSIGYRYVLQTDTWGYPVIVMRLYSDVNCYITLKFTEIIPGMDFRNVIGFTDMVPDPQNIVPGTDNHDFLVTAKLSNSYEVVVHGHADSYSIAESLNTYIQVMLHYVNEMQQHLSDEQWALVYQKQDLENQLQGETDPAQILALQLQIQELETQINELTNQLVHIGEYIKFFRSTNFPCGLYFFQCCWRDMVDFYVSQATSPENVASFATDNYNMLNALSTVVQPIWRPGTKYAVQVITNDNINGSDHQEIFNYYFKTNGPIGQFHKNPGTTDFIQSYGDLKAADKADEFKLATLQHYIDFDHSYPDPSGNLLGAKPLFYESPEIQLAFLQPHVYLMYCSYLNDNYNSNDVGAELEIRLKEPELDISIQVPSNQWVVSSTGETGTDVQIFQNLMESGILGNCISQDTFQSLQMSMQISLGLLKPLKIYTAFFNSVYHDGSIDDTQEVYRFNFQTSRYRNFEEQVDSYLITDANNLAIKEAIYDIAQDFSINNTPPSEKDYPDLYDRMVNGTLHITEQVPAKTTEFNMVVDTATANYGNIKGIIIRNPEPFDDPRRSYNDLSLPVYVANSSLNLTQNTAYSIIISKDRSKIFITNSSMNITDPEITICFRHYKYDISTKTYVELTGDIQAVSVKTKISLSQLVSGDCGATGLSPDYILSADLVTGAEGYEFSLLDTSTNETILYQRNNLDGKLPLAEVAAKYNKTYDIKVRPLINGRFTQFGLSCTISMRQMWFGFDIPTTAMQQALPYAITIKLGTLSGSIFNSITGVSCRVKLNLSGNATGSGIVQITNGIGVTEIKDYSVESIILSLEDIDETGIILASPATIGIIEQKATKLILEGNISAEQGEDVTINILAKNNFNNTDADYTGTAVLNISGAGKFSNNSNTITVLITAGEGSVTINDIVIEATQISIQSCSPNPYSGTTLNISNIHTVEILLKPADSYLISGPTESYVEQNNGSPISPAIITIEAVNEFGTRDTSVQAVLVLTALLSGDVPSHVSFNPSDATIIITEGIGVISTINTSPEDVTFSINIINSGSTLSITDIHTVNYIYPPAQKVLVSAPSFVIQGGQPEVTVFVLDIFNASARYNGTITLVTDGNALFAGNPQGEVTINDGTGTIYITDTHAEIININIVSSNPHVPENGPDATIEFTLASATLLTLEGPLQAIQGDEVQLLIKALNDFGDTDINFNGTVEVISESSFITGLGSVNIVQGEATLSVTDTQVESALFYLNNPSEPNLNIDATLTIAFQIQPATKVVIINPLDGETGVFSDIHFEVQNDYGVIAPTLSNDFYVKIIIVDSLYNEIPIPSNIDMNPNDEGLAHIVNGAGVIQIKNTLEEIIFLKLENVSGPITLTYDSIQDIQFSLSPPTQIEISATATAVQGDSVPVSLRVLNDENLVYPRFDGTALVSVNNNALITESNAHQYNINIINGLAEFHVRNLRYENIIVTIESVVPSGLIIGNPIQIEFTIEPAVALVFEGANESIQGTGVPIIIKAVNNYGDVDSGINMGVNVNSSGSATINVTNPVQITNGIANFVLSDVVAQSVTLSLSPNALFPQLNYSNTLLVLFKSLLGIIFNDTFSSGAGITLAFHFPDIGNNWEKITADPCTLKIDPVSDIVVPGTNGNGVLYLAHYIQNNYLNPDYCVEVKIVSAETQNNRVSILATRIQSNGDMYAIRLNSHICNLFKRRNGVISQIGITTTGISDGIVAKLEIIGNKISFSIDYEPPLITFTDYSNPIISPGNAGLGAGNILFPSDSVNRSNFDNFMVRAGGDFNRIFLDRFTVNGDLIASIPDMGRRWIMIINIGNALGIKVNNGVAVKKDNGRKIGKGSFYIAATTADYTSADYEAELKQTRGGASEETNYIGVRVSADGNNGYFVRFNNELSELYLRNNGLNTKLVELSSGVPNDSKIKLKCKNDSITFLIEDVVFLSVIDSTLTDPGYAGFGIGAVLIDTDIEDNQKIDDFVVRYL